jgi:hypothetical protein
MSYTTIHQCAYDAAFGGRVDACVAQQQKARGETVDPSPLSWPMRWSVASASDVEAAYASALEADNPNPGGDPAVISDGMILSNVQAGWPNA